MLEKALLKVKIARIFHRSRFQKLLSLGESGLVKKTTFDIFWSKIQRFYYTEEWYRNGNWHIDRKENAKSVGEYRRTLALLNVEIMTENSISEEGDYRQNL